SHKKIFYVLKVVSLMADISQPPLKYSVRLGDSVTMECYFPQDKMARWICFKQSFGQAPQNIVHSYSNSEGTVFHEEFKDKPRFTAQKSKTSFNLTLSNIEPGDIAVYYCGVIYVNLIQFGNGTFLILTGNIVQQPVSVPVKPGDEVTIQCTVHTETCEGEPNVYWLRIGSGESLPGVIYTHGNRSDQCEGSSKAKLPAQSCVYNLPKRNLSPSDAGIYFCAVVTCWEIVFGNGTVLEITGVGREVTLNYFTLVLLTTNIVSVVLITFLAYSLMKKHKTAFSKVTHLGAFFHQHTRESSNYKQNLDTEVLNYTALSFTESDARPGRKRTEMDRQAVYSQVQYKQCN
ncbi:KVD12 protein, partial [Atractosteus spatula]|nr:KVD12 protein [Atractosteus spatula]